MAQSIAACEPHLQPHLCGRVVLCGGNARLPGFEARLCDASPPRRHSPSPVAHRPRQNEGTAGDGSLSCHGGRGHHPRVRWPRPPPHKHLTAPRRPTASPYGSPELAAWRGGALLASAPEHADALCMPKAWYDEVGGPQAWERWKQGRDVVATWQ